MPRKITNKAGLPEPMFNALAAETYIGGGDISATRLISPPRIVTLRKFHEDEIEEDASKRIWSLLGQSTHRVLELSAGEGIVVEKRLGMPVEGLTIDGKPWVWNLTAQPDIYHRKVISDYKVTSMFKVVGPGAKTEWEQQLNIQALLHRHNGDEVSEVNIIAILRDWMVRRARFEKEYPPVAVKKISFPLWSKAAQMDFVTERVQLHQQAQLDYAKTKDPDSLPLCTPEERWYRGHGYAVKKMDLKGKVNKKADRVFTEIKAAEQFMRDNSSNLPKGKVYAPIEERKGENIRCLDYCDVVDFCPFGKALKAAQLPEFINLGGSETEEGED